jgi:hypothetical protein
MERGAIAHPTTTMILSSEPRRMFSVALRPSRTVSAPESVLLLWLTDVGRHGINVRTVVDLQRESAVGSMDEFS